MERKKFSSHPPQKSDYCQFLLFICLSTTTSTLNTKRKLPKAKMKKKLSSPQICEKQKYFKKFDRRLNCEKNFSVKCKNWL